MLYLATLYLSKLSSLAYIIQLTPDARHRQWGKGLSLVLSVWFFIALFGVAFECRLPNPWAIVTERCMDIVSVGRKVLDFVADLGNVERILGLRWCH